MLQPDNVENMALHGHDYARTDHLSTTITALLPALEQFMTFSQPERIAHERVNWTSQLEEPLPRIGKGAQAVIEQLRDVVIPNGLRAGHPGFSGWIATMPTTVPAAAHLASAISGPLSVAVQSYNLLEDLGTRWLRELVGLPTNFQGIFTSGGSIANLIGIGAARQYAFESRGIDPAREGVGAIPKPRIYTSNQVHHVTYRASAVLGLGRDAVITLPADQEFHLDPAALRAQIEHDEASGCTPIAIVANAGTINTGAIDPLPELAQLCKEKDIWLHVDGAYGLLGVLDPRISHLYGDLSACGSLVVDPHKWLATSMGCGAVYVRDKKLLERAFTLMPAVYMEEAQPIYDRDTPLTSQFDDLGYEFQNYGVEHSLPSRGVEVWAVLKEIGVEGVRDRVRRHNQYARHLAERILASPHLELASPVVLSTCCFRYVPEELRGKTDAKTTEILNQLNRIILSRVRSRGRVMPSATHVQITNAQNIFVLRGCFINPRMTLADVDAHADEVETCGAEVWSELAH
jgi:Glutamate decarboxylase and related PLP-dependent proteins